MNSEPELRNVIESDTSNSDTTTDTEHTLEDNEPIETYYYYNTIVNQLHNRKTQMGVTKL